MLVLSSLIVNNTIIIFNLQIINLFTLKLYEMFEIFKYIVYQINARWLLDQSHRFCFDWICSLQSNLSICQQRKSEYFEQFAICSSQLLGNFTGLWCVAEPRLLPPSACCQFVCSLAHNLQLIKQQRAKITTTTTKRNQYIVANLIFKHFSHFSYSSPPFPHAYYVILIALLRQVT